MALKKMTVNMMVENVSKSVEFYRNVFKFHFLMAVEQDSENVLMEFSPENTLNFAIMKRNSVEIMLQSRHSLSSEVEELKEAPIGASLTFYIEVSNIDKLYKDLQEFEGVIIKDLKETAFGTKEFYAKDDSGYIWGFSEKK